MPRFLIAYTCCELHGETTLCYVDAETDYKAEELAKEADISGFNIYAREVSQERFEEDYDHLDSLDQKIKEKYPISRV